MHPTKSIQDKTGPPTIPTPSPTISIATLQVEHHESGFSIGHPTPRLSWRFSHSFVSDWTQAGYEICIQRNGAEERFLVHSGESNLVPWPSTPLGSREIAEVAIRVQGSTGTYTDWKSITIEVGLLHRSDWTCQLISNPLQPAQETKKPFQVRQSFTPPASFTYARLYVTAHGMYEASLNGVKVGDHVLAPGWQSYGHHLNYQTFDVTALLLPGVGNVIGGYVGEGWYTGRLGRPGQRNIFGERNGFMAQLEVDGKVVVQTDGGWGYLDGAIITSEIYDGETYDSTVDSEWSTVAGMSTKSTPVEIIPFPAGILISSDAPPVRRIRQLPALQLITSPSGKVILDFGQNLVGWVRFNSDVKGEKGESVVLKYAEVLEHGELGTRPLRTAKCTDTVGLGGRVKGWEPKFTFHGFRYLEVTGYPGSVNLTDFTAIVISSDMNRTGYFSCSHPMLNQLHSNVVWSTLGNFVSIPSDCPQRDERLGWTGDIQVFAKTANYLFDTYGFLQGWLKDVAAETKEYDGVPPVVVPNVLNQRRKPSPQTVWADVVSITPWDLYQAFGDKKVLEDQYESMLLWLDKGLPRSESGNGLWSDTVPQYGDWLDPVAPPQYPANGATDMFLVANAYLVHVTGLMSKIAALLNRPEDVTRYTAAHKHLRGGFQSEYITPNGRVSSDTQTAIALALQFDLLDAKGKKNAVSRLDWLARWDTFKISTGFAGTPIILHALADNDMLHLAYRMLQEKEEPSWLYPVGMGATTIWERWNSMLPDGTINPGQMTSFNHYALGAVASFLHEVVGGISPLEPGWKHVLIRPQPGGTITFANTSFNGPYGLVYCRWNIAEGGMKLEVEIGVPPNTTARVVLPGMDEVVGSGVRKYAVGWESDVRWPPKGTQGPQGLLIRDQFVA